MAAKIDLMLNPPKDKKALTRENILSFIEKQSAEDKKWFVELCDKNMIRKTNNLTKEVIETYNLQVIREEVAKRFFPEISKKGKREKKEEQNKSKKLSMKDRLDAMRNG